MGNSQTKESRSSLPHSNRRSYGGHGRSPYDDRHHAEASRSTRGSRPDLSILGMTGSHERDVASLEHRRETKQQREARRLEKERVARLKERARSMRDEHVDGGYLVTQGVYTGPEDFSKPVVRQLMIERRLAPFWRGLNDFSDSWTEHQLMAAARGLPIPAPDEIPPELEYRNPPRVMEDAKESPSSSDPKSIQHLTVPITSRSQSDGSDASQSSTPAQSLPSTSPISAGTSSSPLFRTRAKTLASLTTSRNANVVDPGPREMQLPHDPFVNGQPMEAYLYKAASECPICFLYYPPYLNRTRCCDQPICSECFVQIKRPEPHPPEHGDADPNAPAPAPAPAPTSEAARADNQDGQLVSEPAACPFCVQPEFGVTYITPPFRRGLTYPADPGSRHNLASPVSSTSSLSSGNVASFTGRRRATSLSAADPAVITTDRIRPDWAQKLANARAHAARRSAAATALHTAAYLMNSNPSSSESRNFGLGRRGVMRRSGAPEGQGSPGRGSPALQALAFLTDRRAPGNETDSAEEGPGTPARSGSRRTRVDDLEDMMMMEAIRLSLASEEERRKREDKEAKKEAKKREKEAKKAEKMARKSGLYSSNASRSTLDVPSGLGRVISSSSSVTGEDTTTTGAGGSKGKEVDRASPAGTGAASPADPSPPAAPRESARPSHLRHVSSASSSFSSVVDSMAEDHPGPFPPVEGTSSSNETMFNFRSLAEVIGSDDDDKPESTEHVEDTSPPAHHLGGSSPGPTSADHPASHGPVVPGSTGSGEDNVSLSEPRDCLKPQELETRSVEIHHSSGNAQT